MSYTLPELCASVEQVAADPDCPAGFVDAVRKFLTQLYGDDPNNFDGPDEISVGPGWLTGYFEDIDIDQRVGKLSLVYTNGVLKASCELYFAREETGIEETICILRSAFVI